MSSGDKPFYSWTKACRFLNDLINQIRPLSGDGIIIEQTDKGTRINIDENTSSNSEEIADNASYPCKITGGSTRSGYSVDIHADGKDQPKTGTGTLEILELFWGDNVPSGTWVIGHPSVVTITGGSEK